MKKPMKIWLEEGLIRALKLEALERGIPVCQILSEAVQSRTRLIDRNKK